jgi:SPP1 gp7 family putative phage head morphogenesis protein
MSTNTALIDAATRHQVFVQLYAAGREKEAIEAIDALIEQVANRISGGNLTALSRARQQELLMDLRLLIDQLNGDLADKIIQEAIDFAEYEAEFSKRMFDNTIRTTTVLPAMAQLEASIFTSIMNLAPSQGYTIRDALKTFGKKKSEQIVQTIRDGIALGDTNGTIQTAVKNLAPIQKSQAATIVRTVANHVSVQARDVVMRDNKDIFTGYEWVSTLDARTSLICMNRDGLIYPFAPESPKPPAHFSCRSTIVPIVDPKYDLASAVKGKRPAVGAQGAKQVPATTTYEQWLKRQPASFQDTVLGPSRGKLFRNGDLSIGRFVDSQGRTLTLDELRRLEPQAFDNAGI